MGRHPLDGGRRKGGRDAGPCLGGNEESKLEAPETELEDPLDMSTQITQITVLALSPPAFCISTPEIQTLQECGLDIRPKP